MTGLLSWMPFEIVRDLGWTLLHFLWQGLLLAALMNAVLPLCRSAIVRHNWALAILAMMALAPVATFVSLHDFGGGVLPDMAAGLNASTSFSPPWITWLVGFWLAGVAALSLRTMGGWFMALSLARQGTLPLPADLLNRCQGLKRRMAMAAPVRFVLSRAIQVPLVIGVIRPVVMIPVSALTGLTPEQLDALILHELAHIRRLDTVINIVLAAVETILFYHPAVWWVGRQLRIEREHCCDDFAAGACGDPALYVEALTSLETWKAAGPALAANGGRLKDRVARLLDAHADARQFSLPATAALLSLALASAAVAANVPGYPSSDRPAITLRPIAETHTLPPYPKQSAHLHEQGTVKLAVTIGTNGAVTHASVTKPSGHPLLDTVAVQYVQSTWRWQPPMRGGKAVVAHTPVVVVFNLRDGSPPAKKP